MKIYNEFLGQIVEIPDHPRRIVSLAPDITDILHRIGVWDRVAGVSLYCKRPPQAEEKPRLGAYLKVHLEKLKEVNPDLILTTTGAQRKTSMELMEMGFPVYPIKLPFSLFDILDNMIRVGAVVKALDKAYTESRKLYNILGEFEGIFSGERVLVEIDLHPEYTIGNASFLNHALWFMGLENIFQDQYASYFQTPYDMVHQRNPDIIIYEPKPMRKNKPTVEEMVSRYQELGLGNVKAVRNRRIIITDGDMVAHYGPAFIDEVMPWLASRLKQIMEK